MRQFKYLIISTVVLFLMINIGYFWESLTFGYNLLLMFFYLAAFLVLVICLICQLFLMVEERFKNRPRVYTVLILGTLLALILAKPLGVIDFEKLEGKDLFVATREGVANCTITLKLKENNKFSLTSICFGKDKMRGTYSIDKGSITLNFYKPTNTAKHYQYGIYNKKRGEILLYTSKQDTMPYPLTVFKNELIK